MVSLVFLLGVARRNRSNKPKMIGKGFLGGFGGNYTKRGSKPFEKTRSYVANVKAAFPFQRVTLGLTPWEKLKKWKARRE